jgi:hypothetical protein
MVTLGSPGAAAAAHHPASRVKCPGKNEEVITADARAVVYASTEGTIRGCAYGARRSYYMGPVDFGSSGGSGGTYPIVLAGAVVAYDVGETYRGEPSRHEIWVRDLASGELLLRVPNGAPAKPGDIGIGETWAIVVKRDGSVAWIADDDGTQELWVSDKAGTHLLVGSPEIAPESLALAGSTLYWTEAGKPMSAQLE